MNTQTKLLPVKPFQETLGGGYCGPASLKLVLDYYGINKNEEELSLMCNRDTDSGVDDEAIKKAAENLGLKVEIKNNASFLNIEKWLDRQVPVIVNWFTRGRYDYPEDDVADGHYSVVVGLDDQFIRDLDVELLKDDGYKVDSGKNGVEGYEKISKGGYDLVLLDIIMPKMDGMQVMVKLSENPPIKLNKHIIFMTNLGEDKTLNE